MPRQPRRERAAGASPVPRRAADAPRDGPRGRSDPARARTGSSRGRFPATAPPETMRQHEHLIYRAATESARPAPRDTAADEEAIDRVMPVVLGDLLRPDDVVDAAADGVRCFGLAEVFPSIRERIPQQHAAPRGARDR